MTSYNANSIPSCDTNTCDQVALQRLVQLGATLAGPVVGASPDERRGWSRCHRRRRRPAWLPLCASAENQNDAVIPPIGVSFPLTGGGWRRQRGRFRWWHPTARVSVREDDGQPRGLSEKQGRRAPGSPLMPRRNLNKSHFCGPLTRQSSLSYEIGHSQGSRRRGTFPF